MNTQAHDRIEAFLADITACDASYGHCRLLVVAIRSYDALNIVYASIIFSPFPGQDDREYDTGVVYCMSREITFDRAKQLLHNIAEGKFDVDGRQFVLRSNALVVPHYDPFMQSALQQQKRMATLIFHGAPRSTVYDAMSLNWSLKAGVPPFDGIGDLVTEMGFELPNVDICLVEVAAINTAEVDVRSRITGTQCTIGMLIATILDKDHARLGYKVVHQRKVVRRGTLRAADMSWEPRGNALCGTAVIEVPAGALVRAFATYGDVVQHEYWIVDPTALPNPRRVAYEVFDNDLKILKECLAASSSKNVQENFEYGVAILLYILGFSGLHLGTASRLRDAPDLLVASYSGMTALVECTIGLPDQQGKLAKLCDRAQQLLQRMNAAGIAGQRVLPVLVTAKSRAQSQGDVDKARVLGIALVCAEELASALTRSVAGLDSDAIYHELAATLGEAITSTSLS